MMIILTWKICMMFLKGLLIERLERLADYADYEQTKANVIFFFKRFN